MKATVIRRRTPRASLPATLSALLVLGSCGVAPDSSVDDVGLDASASESAGAAPEASEGAAADATPATPSVAVDDSAAEKILREMLARKRLEETQAALAAPRSGAAPVVEAVGGRDAERRREDESAPEAPMAKPAGDGVQPDFEKAFEEIAQAVGGSEAAPKAGAADVRPAVAREPSKAAAGAASAADAGTAPSAATGAGDASPPPASPPAPPAVADAALRSGNGAQPSGQAAEPEAQAAQAQRPARPAGKTAFYTFFHKGAGDFINFLRDDFGDLVDKGHVAPVSGKPRTVIFFGEDAVMAQLKQIADEFDDLGLEIQRVDLHPMYVDVAVMMESLTMAGLCNVWSRVEETVSTQQQVNNQMQTISTHKHSVYAQGNLAKGQSAPLPVHPKIPYVFEMPWSDPFQLPRESTGKAPQDQQLTIDFRNPSSTEKRGVIVAVGTAEDIAKIAAFIDSIDRPARQIMIEVQVIELSADAISDIGIDSISFGGGHNLVDFAGPFPGEPIQQPGFDPSLRPPSEVVPPVVSEGLTYLFDDTSFDLSGRFLSRIHALVRTGDAKLKARPKILTLDDRPSILHIGQEVPSFESTGVTRDATNGNLISEVKRVTTQYVGFTLNMRPKVSGDDADEVALQLEVVANQLQGRERVFEEDLAGIPIVARRRFTGQPRVKNHRPIILGGLINEEEVESASKVPFLGEIPYLGKLFSRTQKQKRRQEVIMVVTPHVLSETGIDRAATPKESAHFDTFDSVLFNDRHIIKGRDVWGIDPITKMPAMVKGEVFSEQEVIDLTLLNIVKQRLLVSKLNIFEEYLIEDVSKLSWLQRKYPERSVYYWPEDKKEVYFKAAAIVIENIKELNHPLKYEDIVVPRREIVLPTTPYRMTLSYDKYKTLMERGTPVLRGDRVELSEATIALLKDVALQRTLRHFADYVRRNQIPAERHGELRSELSRLYSKAAPPDAAAPAEDYATFFEDLAKSRIDFVTIATYFQENLDDRYRTTGRPNLGSFEADLTDFLKTTVTITQRAKRLQELETKWNTLSSDE